MTVVWGKMVDWYLDWNIPSLLQPGNLPALKDANYFLYTDEQEKIRASIPPQVNNVRVEVLPLVNGRGHVNDCVKDRAARSPGHLAVFPAEFVFGDGSLKNLEAACQNYDLVVYSFPRCDLAITERVVPILKEKKTLSNPELVSLAMRYLHRETAPPHVLIKRVNGHLWKVHHLVPNLVIKITDKSLSLINSIPTNNGLLDHCVPYQCIQAGMSYHYIQSSDEVFLVEPTQRSLAFCHTEPYKKQTDWDIIAAHNMEFWGKFELTWAGLETDPVEYTVRDRLTGAIRSINRASYRLVRRVLPGWLFTFGIKQFYSLAHLFRKSRGS